jgi:hypothetical protein
MEISPNVYNLINILLQALLWSLIISTPFIILTLEMYAYGKYKKWKNSDDQEHDKIIIKRANQIIAVDDELSRQADEKKKLDLELDLLNIRKKSLQDELGISQEPEVDELEIKEPENEIDLSTMNIRELKALAKERGLTMYSKKNKAQLLKILEG